MVCEGGILHYDVSDGGICGYGNDGSGMGEWDMTPEQMWHMMEWAFILGGAVLLVVIVLKGWYKEKEEVVE